MEFQARRTQDFIRVGAADLSLPQVWAAVSLASIFVILALGLIRPHDFWWHVRAGQWIVDNGRVPAIDLFSYTRAGEPWAYQSWLMEIVLYLWMRAGGLPLVIFFHAAIITAAYGLSLWVNQHAAGGNLRWAALATMAAATLGIANWNVRPQTISFLFFALTLYAVERHAAKRLDAKWLWLLPPLFAVWANAHGGFVFGLALLGAYLLTEMLAWLRRQRPFPTRLLLVTLLSAGATLLTPIGLGMADYVLGFVKHPVTRSLNMEFWPPTIRSLDGQIFFAYLAILVVLLVASRYRPTPRQTVYLLLFGVLAVMSRRNTAWFGLVAAPTMAASLYHWTRHRHAAGKVRAGRIRTNYAMLALVGVVAFLSLPWFRPYLPLPEDRRAFLSPETPVEAVAYLRTLPSPRRVFHTEGSGSYMIWASPEVPVFVDTRIELYSEEQWFDYLALSSARYDWQAILERYGVDTLLLDREQQEHLVKAATAAPGWERTYEDEEMVIIEREGGP
ncbi:hypothetical protein ACFLWA_02370 [Chloroflexota bacterium]